jgi:Flp pilus assembly protein CpaB
MNQFLSRLRRANSVLATFLDRLVRSLQVKRRSQTAAVVCVAVTVSVLVASTISGARHARSSWGTTATVVVSTRFIEPGEMLDGTNTQSIVAPIGVIPDDALDSIPSDATVRTQLSYNTIISQWMISGSNRTPDIPKDWRVVAMPVDVTAPLVAPGDTVDVVSTDAVLAAGAIVVSEATDTQGPSVAVPRDVAPLVATAARDGVASLILAS